jgi:hypothetical protein
VHRYKILLLWIPLGRIEGDMLERSEKEVRGWVRARPIGVKLVEHG